MQHARFMALYAHRALESIIGLYPANFIAQTTTEQRLGTMKAIVEILAEHKNGTHITSADEVAMVMALITIAKSFATKESAENLKMTHEDSYIFQKIQVTLVEVGFLVNGPAKVLVDKALL